MAPKCAGCGANLLDRMRIHVFVNGKRIPGAFLCYEHGKNSRNMLQIDTGACLRCGTGLAGQLPVSILVDRRSAPGSLCLDHGANGDDEMTAAQYARLVVGNYATAA